MPQGSCKRYNYLPLLGGTEISCNHIRPHNDVVRSAREWYDITPLTSTTVFHRLNEDTDKLYDNKGRTIKRPVGKLQYRDIFSANWFTFETYYRGLPLFLRIVLRIVIYTVIIVFLWKLVVRPLIGPSGVLIHTKNLREDNVGESLMKRFFEAVNQLKVPKSFTKDLDSGTYAKQVIQASLN